MASMHAVSLQLLLSTLIVSQYTLHAWKTVASFTAEVHKTAEATTTTPCEAQSRVLKPILFHLQRGLYAATSTDPSSFS